MTLEGVLHTRRENDTHRYKRMQKQEISTKVQRNSEAHSRNTHGK